MAKKWKRSYLVFFIQSNSVITNSIGPSVSVQYNHGDRYNREDLCSKMGQKWPVIFVHYSREFVITVIVITYNRVWLYCLSYSDQSIHFLKSCHLNEYELRVCTHIDINFDSMFLMSKKWTLKLNAMNMFFKISTLNSIQCFHCFNVEFNVSMLKFFQILSTFSNSRKLSRVSN